MLKLVIFNFMGTLVAVKRIREIMAGVDGNSNLQQAQPVITQPQRMPVPSPMSTPSFNQPSAIFDRQPLPPGVSNLLQRYSTLQCTCAITYK